MKDVTIKKNKTLRAITKQGLSILILLVSTLTLNAQIVNIPNANFKAALMAHSPTIDINNDGEIQVSEAVAFTDTINVHYKDISDLTGIEAFINITALYCSFNPLDIIDISANASLTYLVCYNSSLDVLDINANTELRYLNCSGNYQLESLDLSENTELEYLDCSDIHLTNIEVSNNTELTYLNCSGNYQLTHLDVTAHTEITYLNCSGLQLSSLSVINNPELTKLYCYDNELSSLDLSANPLLTDLHCWNNPLNNLDVSNNPELTDLDCSSNQLTNLDLSNNTLLTDLHCWNNSLTSLNVGAHTEFTHIDCSTNQILSLDVSANSELSVLICSNNQISSLDVSANVALDSLYCSNNQLSSLDVSENTELTVLIDFSNGLSSLDVSANTELINLNCSNNELSNIDVSSNTELISLRCSGNELTSLNVNANTLLFELLCTNNQLTSLDLSLNTALTTLWLYGNSLTSLNVKNGNNTNITSFYAEYNQNLTCIQVDDPIYSTNNWTDIDAGVSFAENCIYGIVEPNIIYGNVLLDDDCIIDVNTQAVGNNIVRTEPEHFYGITDSLGGFEIFTDTGTYHVKQIITHPLINTLCPIPNYHTVVFNSLALDTTDINFFYQVLECPLLKVDLKSDRRRRCFTNNTYVEYCNTGFAEASGVEVTVQMPEYVVFVSSDYSYTIDGQGNYVFDIGSLSQGECGTIHIIDSVACLENITGLTQCTEVWITPSNDCADALDTGYDIWDKSSLRVEGECLNDTIVHFTIINTGDFGEGDMEAPQDYRIYLDNVLVLTENFQLNGGESINIDYPSNGQTIRLEADQHPSHPGNSHPQETIEACGDDNGTISTGFVNQQAMDDADFDKEIECLEILDSYDPNDKSVSPEGISYLHYLEAGTLLDYQIRFQNTGSDTAFTVVLVDTLSGHLDPSTIQWGISSHPNTVEVNGMGTPVLKFTFNNIDLPDSTTNELGSHGFIKFKVEPYDTLANGTEINNKAYIFFDYNLPIVTNTAQITISDTVFTYTPTLIESISKEAIRIYPNPTTGIINIVAEHLEKVEVYNISGVKVKSTNKKEIDLSQQTKGIYLIKVMTHKGTMIKKIIIE